jgi:FKBP-type peptidyl-prolyl cis-trans isomerase FkpA
MSFTFRVNTTRIRQSAARAALIAFVACIACGGDSTSPAGSDPTADTFASSLGVNLASMTKLSNALYVQDQVVGAGPLVANGQTLVVVYTGWLTDGTKFDSDAGAPTLFSFVLGKRAVIAGWDQGIVGMHVGGKRLLVIGSDLGYGAQGSGPIPPNATLVFTVQIAAAQ